MLQSLKLCCFITDVLKKKYMYLKYKFIFIFFNPKELGYSTEMDVVHASLSHKCERYCTRKSPEFGVSTHMVYWSW